jgi:class 3 adenylate cyclase
MPANLEEPRSEPGRTWSGTPNLEMAYVLFMDLVAYSIMAMDRQTQVLQQLQELVQSSDEFQRAHADGQLVSLPTGDGMALVFFHNPVSAVQCAVEIARALRGYPSIRLRMGVHAGPVYRIADINTSQTYLKFSDQAT